MSDRKHISTTRQSHGVQNRPIILNRRSFSSSSIPRKKNEFELPRNMSRDESYALRFCTGNTDQVPVPVESSHTGSQTVPLPSHKLPVPVHDICGLDEYLTPISSVGKIEAQRSLNIGNFSNTAMHQLILHQVGLQNPYRYLMINQNIPIGPTNSADGKNIERPLGVVSSRSMKSIVLDNPSNATELYTSSQTFQRNRVLLNEGSNCDNTMNESQSAVSWMGQMDASNILPPIDTTRKFEIGRPPYSYMALIQFAINSSPNRRLTLKQIYSWIEETFPYFKNAKPGWKNSIRHNLSLHDIFTREILPSSKSSYWTLRPDLNHRPLTLGCVAARMDNIHPVPLSVIGPGNEGATTPQQFSRLMQPCVLLPLNQNSSTPNIKRKRQSQQTDFTSPATQSQIPGDGSACNPDVLCNNSVLSCVDESRKEQSAKRRKRKQSHEILHDSLNDSLHLTESLKSPLVSPLLLDDDQELTHFQCSESTSSSFLETKQERGMPFSQYQDSVPLSLVARMPFDEPESGYFEQTYSSSLGDTSVTSKRRCNVADDNMHRSTINENVGACTSTACKSNYGDTEFAISDGLPQLLGVDGFSFNSSFSKLLNSSSVSLLNLSDRSVQFSDFEDALG